MASNIVEFCNSCWKMAKKRTFSYKVACKKFSWSGQRGAIAPCPPLNTPLSTRSLSRSVRWRHCMTAQSTAYGLTDDTFSALLLTCVLGSKLRFSADNRSIVTVEKLLESGLCRRYENCSYLGIHTGLPIYQLHIRVYTSTLLSSPKPYKRPYSLCYLRLLIIFSPIMNPPVKPRNVFLITCSANNKHGERVHLRRTPVLTQNQVDTILAVLIAVRCCLQRLRRG